MTNIGKYMEKTYNMFDLEITAYERVKSTDGKTMPLREFLWNQANAEKVKAMRAMTDTEQKKKAKAELPCATISGVFDGGHSAKNLKTHSGLIAIDIDPDDNPTWIGRWAELKNLLMRETCIGYIGLSCRGNGLYCIVRLAYPKKHLQQFRQLQEDFRKVGLVVDSSCSDVSRLRFASYDPAPFVRCTPTPYQGLKVVQPMQPTRTTSTRSYRFGKDFDVEEFLHTYGIEYSRRDRDGGTQYVVQCPWKHLHSSRNNGESAIFVYPSGSIGYRCMHAHCAERTWQDFRQFYDPTAYERKDRY